jgi:hypothetical protein
MHWRLSSPFVSLPLTAAAVAIVAAAGGSPAAQGPSAPSPPGFEQLRKVDVHSHVYEDLPVVNAMLRRINLRVINVSVPATDGHLDFMHRFNAALVKRHPDIFSFASTFDLAARNEPDYGARTAKALDATFAQGAVMVKIWKEVGIELKRPDGSFLLPDDPSSTRSTPTSRRDASHCWPTWRSRSKPGCRSIRRASTTATTRATRAGTSTAGPSSRATRG